MLTPGKGKIVAHIHLSSKLVLIPSTCGALLPANDKRRPYLQTKSPGGVYSGTAERVNPLGEALCAQ